MKYSATSTQTTVHRAEIKIDSDQDKDYVNFIMNIISNFTDNEILDFNICKNLKRESTNFIVYLVSDRCFNESILIEQKIKEYTINAHNS